MAEDNKCSIYSDLENDSSETKVEIPSISDQPAQTSNTGQLEERPEDTKTAKTAKDVDIDSPPKSSLLPPPAHQGDYSSTANLKTSVVESLSPTSRNQPENKKSVTEGEIPVIPEKNPRTVSTSNSEQTAEFFKETTPELIDNTSSGIAKPLPSVHQHVQDTFTDSAMEPAPSTSSNESPRKVKQSHEGLDQILVDQVQKLELEEKTRSPECMSKTPSKGLYIKSKMRNRQSTMRKTGLTSVWNKPDKDFVPMLKCLNYRQPTSIQQRYEETRQGTLSDFQCRQCHRMILGNSSEHLCRKCIDKFRRVASEPEGACGGITSDPHYLMEGATAEPYEIEYLGPHHDDLAAYIFSRHREREKELSHHGTTNKQHEDAYGDYERRDSEEEYRRMHYSQREIPGALPPTPPNTLKPLAESWLWAGMSRPGATVEEMRSPEQEELEVQHYRRQMAKLAAKFVGAPLEETSNPWKPQEFYDQETLYKLWRPPTDPAETRRRPELEMRAPREQAEKMLEQKDESEESGSESEDEDTESLPSGSKGRCSSCFHHCC